MLEILQKFDMYLTFLRTIGDKEGLKITRPHSVFRKILEAMHGGLKKEIGFIF